jgi:predicted Zn-dependent protease
MQSELARAMKALEDEPTPPYFLCYELKETHGTTVGGSFGALTSSAEYRRRQLDIDLRAGGYELDNTHRLRGNVRFMSSRRPRYIEMPVDDDPDAIAAVLLYQTNQAYKRAVEDLTKVRTNVEVKVEQEDRSQDFSREEPARHIDPIRAVRMDRTEWEGKIKRYTAPFAEHGDIYKADAELTAIMTTRWLVNSEGSAIQTSEVRYRLFISAMTKAEDGMELPRYESFTAFTPQALPDDETVLATVRTMIRDLETLREAPIVDPYTGPAILNGRAAGVFFHEVFGHRVEGHRQKDEDEGQTFKKKIGEQITPPGFSVYFDPTLAHAAGTDLAGHYRYDNEGVKARRVPVLEDGVFKGFLMSRTPIEGFSSSNGHGRRQAGYRAVARQSNLIVEVDEPVSREALKRQLLELIREEERPFGLIFEDIQGGFTMTGRMVPNAFNVIPILVYRVFPDGREELVRGVDLIGTPLIAFSSIVAGNDRKDVFNGTCGAESGGVPVTAVSPGVLLRQIEVQKKQKSQDRPPQLPAPPVPGQGGS